MKSTFDEFITDDPKQKALFDKEYDDFLLSEFIIQKMEEENLSVRSLAQKASVSPTVIQKLRNNESAEKNTCLPWSGCGCSHALSRQRLTRQIS